MIAKFEELQAERLLQFSAVKTLQKYVICVEQSMREAQPANAPIKNESHAESRLQDVISTKIEELEAQTLEQATGHRELRAQVIAVEQSMRSKQVADDIMATGNARPWSFDMNTLPANETKVNDITASNRDKQTCLRKRVHDGFYLQLH